MKKQYFKPACNLLAMDTTVSILVASPEKVNPGGGDSSSDVTKDTSPSGGWAGSKGNTFGTWEADED